jgi:hypothetical protein
MTAWRRCSARYTPAAESAQLRTGSTGSTTVEGSYPRMKRRSAERDTEGGAIGIPRVIKQDDDRPPASKRIGCSKVALLLKAGGFEGLVKLGASTEHFKPGDPSIADLPRKENWVADASVTSRHQARNTPHADDLVATIVKLFDLLTGTRQALPLRSSHSGKPVVTSPRARLNRCGGIDVLDLRIGKGEQALDVLAVPSVHQAANDLEVLLRHRPRSISRRPPFPSPARRTV